MGIFEENITFWQSHNTQRTNSNKYIKRAIAQTPTLFGRLANLAYLKSTKSKAPQAVLKIISNQVGKAQVRRLMDYISRENKKDEEKLVLESDQDQTLKTREEREKIIELWEKDFEGQGKYKKQQWKIDKLEQMDTRRQALSQQNFLSLSEKVELTQLESQIENQYCCDEKGKKISLKIRGVTDTKHILLSIGGQHNESNQTKIGRAVKEFLERNFQDNGFSYVYVCHNDTKNLHYHVLVKSKNVFNRNLYFCKSDLFILRYELSRYLSEMGIERVATLRRDRAGVLEKIMKGTERLKEREGWYKNQIKTRELKGNVFKTEADLIRQADFLARWAKNELKKGGIFGIGNGELWKNLREIKSLTRSLLETKKESEEDKELLAEKIETTVEVLKNDGWRLAEKVGRSGNSDLEVLGFKKLGKGGVSELEFQNLGEDSARELKFGDDKKRRKYLKSFLERYIKEVKQAKKEILGRAVVKTKGDRVQLKEALLRLDGMVGVGKDKLKDR